MASTLAVLVFLILFLYFNISIAIYITDSGQKKLDLSKSAAKWLALVTFLLPPSNIVVAGALAML